MQLGRSTRRRPPDVAAGSTDPRTPASARDKQMERNRQWGIPRIGKSASSSGQDARMVTGSGFIRGRDWGPGLAQVAGPPAGDNILSRCHSSSTSGLAGVVVCSSWSRLRGRRRTASRPDSIRRGHHCRLQRRMADGRYRALAEKYPRPHASLDRQGPNLRSISRTIPTRWRSPTRSTRNARRAAREGRCTASRS